MTTTNQPTTESPQSSPAPRRASFRALTEGTAQDWQIINEANEVLERGLPDRVLAHLRLLGGEDGGFAVDRLTHSLQTATRAERAGRADDYVLCALLHDLGDTLAPYNHADIGAAIVKPFVSPELHWMVERHAEFQGYYYFQYFGIDRNIRDRHRDNPSFDLTAEFCAEYDQTSFDPDYPTNPIEHYEPLIHDLMAAPRRTGSAAGG
ncbi:phosphohydrolase [Pseudofrankia sp. EUN1h]|nr:phosphohydrolase [Pseudofrankia sp. EUN1h]